MISHALGLAVIPETAILRRRRSAPERGPSSGGAWRASWTCASATMSSMRTMASDG